MTASIPLPRLATFGWLKTKEKAKNFRESAAKIAAYSFEHFLFLGGLAGISYGAWMVYHPAGAIVGGWMATRVAFLISAEHGR